MDLVNTLDPKHLDLMINQVQNINIKYVYGLII
jgi:hypothetical protein